ncbi:MAG: zinc ABC transporter substrate-binding protein [Planctomycetota bacterium]|nr:zinc ABC transporter substrate-binding protein [Planctomycetota bacterium]
MKARALFRSAAMIFGLLAGLAFLSGGCGGGKPPAASGRLKVCASIFPVHEWAKDVAGPDADVYLLEGGGGDPHNFSPSMKDIGEIARARALLVVGLGLDPWSTRAVESNGETKVELLRVGEWVERRAVGAGKAEEGHDHHDHAHHDHDHGHAHGEPDIHEDPHVWLDPNRAAKITERLGEEFARMDPAHAEGYRARAKAAAEALRALATELAEAAKPVRGKKVLTLHDAYGYLFDLCGIELAGVLQVNPHLEPSAQDLTNATAQLRAIGQKVVFSEPQKEGTAKVLAETVGGTQAMLDPLELRQSPAGKTYAERLRYNVRTLVEHLK